MVLSGFRLFNVLVTTTKNLEIKAKKPGDLGRNLEVYRWHKKELKTGVGKT